MLTSRVGTTWRTCAINCNRRHELEIILQKKPYGTHDFVLLGASDFREEDDGLLEAHAFERYGGGMVAVKRVSTDRDGDMVTHNPSCTSLRPFGAAEG